MISIIIFSIIVVGSLADTGNNHHYNHHRHHRHRQEEDLQVEEESTERATYRNFSVGMGQSVEEGESPAFSGSLERRLAALEKDVGYLCLEDEDDIERRIRHLGIKCVCPTTEAPVCGSDHVTYRNRCFLSCHAKHALLHYHRHRITLKYFGPCGHELI